MTELKNKYELKKKYDLIVAGGGIAGISAAVKAARMGISVLLVEQYGFAGGMSTAGMVSPFMKHSIGNTPLVRGVFEDLEEHMRRQGGMLDNGFSAQSFRSSAYGLLKESGCTVLLNSTILGVSLNGDYMESLSVSAAGQKLSLQAKVFIDTTGDAQLLYLGRLPWTKGDEKTGRLQALTLFFRMAGIDVKKATDYVKENRDDFFSWVDQEFDLSRIVSVAGYFSNVKRAIDEGRLDAGVEYIFFTTLPSTGEASFNTTNILGLDASDSFQLTQAELLGRRQAAQVCRLLQKEIPGFENAWLLETAPQVGVRETRRAVGDYQVSGEDIRKGQKFPDAVARGCYGIDIHGQKDESSVMEHLSEGEYYEVPLRALFVKGVRNLLAAGRCISSTREGHSALRIMPTSAATGEACGAVSALAVLSGISVREVPYDMVASAIGYNIQKIQ